MGDRDRSPRRSGGMNDSGRTRMKRGPVERRIFINNLPYESKWQDVKDLFRREVGEVNFVELFLDEQGRPRGAGIMEFATVDLAKKAIEKMNKHDFAGRKIVVKEDADVARDKHGRIITDKDKERFRTRERSNAPAQGGSRGGDGGQGGAGGGVVDYGNTYGLSVRFLESLGINVPLNQRIFVSNLAYDIDDRKLREVFRLAGTVVAVDVSKDKEGKSRGFGIIVYDHPVEAVQAISMFNEQQLFDRRLSVRMDKAKDNEPPRNMNRLPDGLSGVGMGLGDNGAPLWDVRNNLPNEASGGSSGGLNNMSMGLGQDMGAQQAAGMQTNNTAAALQTALATIMSVGLNNSLGQGSGGAAAGLLANAGLSSGLSSGMTGSSNGMGGGMDLAMGGGMSDRMGGMSDRIAGGMTDRMGMSDRMAGMSDSRMSGMSDRMMGAMSDRIGGGMSDRMGSMSDHMGGMVDRMGGMSDSKMGLSGGMDMDRMGAGLDRDRGMMGSSRDSRGGMSSMGDNRGGMSSMGGSGGGGGGGMSGARGKFSDKVIVRNLPDSISWQNLKEKFRTVGDVKYAEIKERGCGIIRFASEREAERAVGAMNRQRLDGRTLEVAIY